MKKTVTLVLAALMLVALLAGCGTTSSLSPSASVSPSGSAGASASATPDNTKYEIRHMNPITAGSSAYDYFQEFVTQYQKDHPNITIIHDSLPSADLRQKMIMDMASGSPADCAWMIRSYLMQFAKDNKLMDWKKVYDDPQYAEVLTWYKQTARDYLKSPDTGIYMANPREASIDGLFVNDEIMKANGWVYPNNFTELVTLAGKCKEKGISLLVAGGKDIRFAWLASALLIRTGGPENADKLALGDQKTYRWDDPKMGWVDATKKFMDLVKAGAYPEGVLGMTVKDSDDWFAAGKSLMYYEGAWKVGNFITAGGEDFAKKLKLINFPVMPDMPLGKSNYGVGGAITGEMIAGGLDAGKEKAVIEYELAYLHPDVRVTMMARGGETAAVSTEYDKSKLNPLLVQLLDRFQSVAGYIPSMDAYAPAEIDNAIKKTSFPGIITGEYKTVEEAVAVVQKAADDFAKK